MEMLIVYTFQQIIINFLRQINTNNNNNINNTIINIYVFIYLDRQEHLLF